MTAPGRLLWRCWRRWRNQTFVLALGIVLSPVIAVVYLGRFVKNLRAKKQKKQEANPARSRTANATSTIQLMTVYSGPGPGNSVLERLLAMDDLFFQFAKNAHAVDVLRLSLVSRSTRAAIKQHWHSKACQKYMCDESMTRCWACDMVVCKVSWA